MTELSDAFTKDDFDAVSAAAIRLKYFAKIKDEIDEIVDLV